MRIKNESSEGTHGPFDELFRLQADFQKQLAEETLKYLRQLQGMVGPVVPGTIISPETANEASTVGVAGGRTELELEVENRQRVFTMFTMVTPMLAPLVGPAGVTWFPAAEPRPVSMLIAPGDAKGLVIGLPLPADLPAGIYRGVLMLYGFREGGIPVSVRVTRQPAAKKKAPASKTAAAKKKKTATKKRAAKPKAAGRRSSR